MEYEKECIICHRNYTAKRRDSKTCGINCRVKLSFIRRLSLFIGTIPLQINEKGKVVYYEVDLEKLCMEVGIDMNHLYLMLDKKEKVMRVYAYKQENIK